jgi:hypothetical protein
MGDSIGQARLSKVHLVLLTILLVGLFLKNTGDGSWGQVYVSVDSGEERLFAGGARGASGAAWIWPSKEYEFRLYAGTERAPLL